MTGDGTYGHKVGDIVLIGTHGLKLWRITGFGDATKTTDAGRWVELESYVAGKRTWHAYASRLVATGMGAEK